MKDPEKLTRVLFEAAQWILTIEDGPLSDAEKARFLAWLRSSPLHVREYLSAARVARCLPFAFKDGPIQDGLIDTLVRAVPEQLEESERWSAVSEVLETLGRRRSRAESPLPGAIRRKENGVSPLPGAIRRKGNRVSRDS